MRPRACPQSKGYMRTILWILAAIAIAVCVVVIATTGASWGLYVVAPVTWFAVMGAFTSI